MIVTDSTYIICTVYTYICLKFAKFLKINAGNSLSVYFYHVSAGANYELPSVPLTTILPKLVRYSLFDRLTIQLLDVETKQCQKYQMIR